MLVSATGAPVRFGRTWMKSNHAPGAITNEEEVRSAPTPRAAWRELRSTTAPTANAPGTTLMIATMTDAVPRSCRCPSSIRPTDTAIHPLMLPMYAATAVGANERHANRLRPRGGGVTQRVYKADITTISAAICPPAQAVTSSVGGSSARGTKSCASGGGYKYAIATLLPACSITPERRAALYGLPVSTSRSAPLTYAPMSSPRAVGSCVRVLNAEIALAMAEPARRPARTATGRMRPR